MKVVQMSSMVPVTVVTKELVVLVEALDVVVLEEVRVAVLYESTEELLTPGEQPTKFGADSLTAVQDAILKAIASAFHQH